MALLYSGLGLLDPEQNLVPGKVRVDQQEKAWHWFPDGPWRTGRYIIRVSTDVEDLAGNNLQRLFDKPYTHSNPNPAASNPDFIEIPVDIKPY